MIDKKLDNTACDFDGDLAGYLYDEIGASQKCYVEGHLAVCDECSAELKGAAMAAMSVREWKVLEFASIQPPNLDVDTGHVERLPSWSLWAALKTFSSPLPAMAVAFVILVSAALLFIGYPLLDAVDVSSVSAPVNNQADSDEDRLPVTRTDGSQSSIEPGSGDSRKIKDSPAPRPARVQTVASTTSKRSIPKRTAQKRSSVLSDGSVAKGLPSKPTLSGFEEGEDDTLRLGDIFSEIDAS